MLLNPAPGIHAGTFLTAVGEMVHNRSDWDAMPTPWNAVHQPGPRCGRDVKFASSCFDKSNERIRVVALDRISVRDFQKDRSCCPAKYQHEQKAFAR